MIVHGRWEPAEKTHRPVIYATLYHPKIPKQIPFEFLIDTGADVTLISPSYIKRLQIPESLYQHEVKPVSTLSGYVPFRYLSDCNIIFTDEEKKAHLTEKVVVYCPPKPRKLKSICRSLFKCRGAEIMAENRKYPCLLGRDVLQNLSLGCCKNSDLLFVSKRHEDYKDALSDFHPKVSEDISDDKAGPIWIDGFNKIDDISVDFQD